MTYNINTLNAMQRLINTYLEEQGHLTMLSHELETVIDHLRGDRKIPAIKFVREVTKKSQPVLFNLDLSNHEGTPFSDFTHWAETNDMDMATSEVKARYLDLKKAKDLVEFIQLNLEYLAG